jgi:hypothetical protein
VQHQQAIVTSTTNTPSLTIEQTADGYRVHWRVERRYGRNTVVDLGNSQSFATQSEAVRWRATFASALDEDEPTRR